MVIQSEPNAYSKRWFTSFHVPIPDARTIVELDFICSFAPLPDFVRIVDVCCGMGRHARALAKRGYSVTGIERDSNIVTKARELGGGPRYIQADVRDFQPERAANDVVIVMGQSFGHFDAPTNRIVLGRLVAGIRAGGRLILDLWNRDFFAAHQGERNFELPEGVIHETKRVHDGRLFVHLSYPDGEQEDFEWQLFSFAEMEAVVAPLGLRFIAYCTNFDASAEPSASQPRMQFVMERSE